MKTLLATDVHISIYDGKYLLPTQVSTILKRYYKYFGKLSFCGRIKEVATFTPSYEDVTEMIDELIVLPSFGKTMLGFYNKKITKAVKNCDFVICRCHGIIPVCVADVARKHKKIYFAESMGCAWDAYWNHGLSGKLLAAYLFLKMKQTVYHADFALYVTSKFLQKRYPCKNESVNASNVLIKKIDDKYLTKRLEKIAVSDFKNITLMTTAALDVRYKGQEFVIRAIPQLNRAGIRVKYLLVGGGNDTFLRSVAKRYRVEDQVEILGRRPLDEVFQLLDDADIYIQPSLQEGLPRSIIEAMSRGCPVIGAKTAGIPELIPSECVVRRKSAKAIAETIVKISNAGKMAELAKVNFEESKSYQDVVLSLRRNKYYQKVLGALEENGANEGKTY